MSSQRPADANARARPDPLEAGTAADWTPPHGISRPPRPGLGPGPLEQDASWMADAACRGADPDLFFPTRGEQARKASWMCAKCPVADPCREYAVADPTLVGIWAGTSVRSRRAIRRERQAGTGA